MTPADADATADAIQRANWGGRHVKMAFVARHPECRAFVADAGGTIVGSGVTTINGPVAWIGTIWVDPAWRGRGLGTALTQATIEAGEDAGCRALVLPVAGMPSGWRPAPFRCPASPASVGHRWHHARRHDKPPVGC